MEPSPLRGPVIIGPDDEVLAIGVGGEVAVGDLGDEEVIFLRNGELLAKRGPHPGLERRVIFTVFGSESPLVAEEGSLVEVGGDLVDADALGHSTAEERRREEGVVEGDRRRPFGETLGCLGFASEPSVHVLGRQFATEEWVVFSRALELLEAVHRAQSLEGVTAVEDPTLVGLTKVSLDVGTGEGCTAEEDRDLAEAPSVELF